MCASRGHQGWKRAADCDRGPDHQPGILGGTGAARSGHRVEIRLVTPTAIFIEGASFELSAFDASRANAVDMESEARSPRIDTCHGGVLATRFHHSSQYAGRCHQLGPGPPRRVKFGPTKDTCASAASRSRSNPTSSRASWPCPHTQIVHEAISA